MWEVGLKLQVAKNPQRGPEGFLFVHFAAVLALRISLYLLSLMQAMYKLRVAHAVLCFKAFSLPDGCLVGYDKEEI